MANKATAIDLHLSEVEQVHLDVGVQLAAEAAVLRVQGDTAHGHAPGTGASQYVPATGDGFAPTVGSERVAMAERQEGNSLLRSMPGTHSFHSRSQPGLQVNIRGMTGAGRVNTMIDGVPQTFRNLSGHGGSFDNMAYVDPNMLAGADISRGAVSGAEGLGTLSGSANLRTVGIDEKPSQDYLDRVRDVFGFEPPREHGHHTVESVEAMLHGTAKVFIGMGGNFVRAVPDTDIAYSAMRKLNLTVGIATKLNRGHLVHGKDALILPVVARSERIETSAGEQFVTIEDSMSNVTASRGVLTPASEHCMPEVEIVCRMAMAALPDSKVDWAACMHDYALVRDLIADVYPEIYSGFNDRIQDPRGFHLDIPPRRRVWPTPNGKANILVLPGLEVNDVVEDPTMLRLATVRSHDQYNTTVYSYNDRYRGVYNDRMILFMNLEDRVARGISKEGLVSLETISSDGVHRRVDGLTVLDYPMPRGAIAGYYPELNPLLPLDYFDRISGTPAAKSIPVRMIIPQ